MLISSKYSLVSFDKEYLESIHHLSNTTDSQFLHIEFFITSQTAVTFAESRGIDKNVGSNGYLVVGIK
jgi:hypothetical protein